jgi:hypothetical protein
VPKYNCPMFHMLVQIVQLSTFPGYLALYSSCVSYTRNSPKSYVHRQTNSSSKALPTSEKVTDLNDCFQPYTNQAPRQQPYLDLPHLSKHCLSSQEYPTPQLLFYLDTTLSPTPTHVTISLPHNPTLTMSHCSKD